MKKGSKTLKWVGLALAGLGAAAISSSAMANVNVETRGGLKVYNSPDRCHWFSIHGRVEADEVIFAGSAFEKQNDFPSGANLRRALLGLSGGLGDDLFYRLAVNFDGSQVTINKAWLGWMPCVGCFDNVLFRVGQITPLSSMEGVTDFGDAELTNGQIFLESALEARAFSSRFRRALGVMANAEFANMFTLGLTVYQPEHGSYGYVNGPGTNPDGVRYVLQRDLRKSDKLGEAVRLTFAPIHCEGSVYHFGLFARNQSLIHTDTTLQEGGDFFTNGGSTSDTVTTMLFSTVPEARARNTFEALDAGPIRAKNFQHYAGEFATICGPLHAEAEYHYVKVHRKPRSPVGDTREAGNVHFHGYHLQGGYVLTGESREYDFAKGAILGITPCTPCGALELVARYSYLNLISRNIYGGSAHNVTLGLNWYVNCNVRIMGNYIRSTIRSTADSLAGADLPPMLQGQAPANAAKRRLDIFGLRFQWVF